MSTSDISETIYDTSRITENIYKKLDRFPVDGIIPYCRCRLRYPVVDYCKPIPDPPADGPVETYVSCRGHSGQNEAALRAELFGHHRSQVSRSRDIIEAIVTDHACLSRLRAYWNACCVN